MLTKTTAFLAAALIVGTASAALAGNDNAANSGEEGGSHIGPLGQCFVPPNCGQERGSQGYQSGSTGFAYVPAHPYQHHRNWHRAR
jgi:hypothetical protein